MKNLILLRHSKTENAAGIPDKDRELLDKGIMDGAHKAMVFKSKELTIDKIVASSARRTEQTAVLIAERIGNDPDDIVYNDDLYLCSAPKMLEIINELDDQWNNVLIVAHNPGTTYIADYLASNEDFNHIPTSGMVVLTFDIDSWQEVSQGMGNVLWYDFSKNENR